MAAFPSASHAAPLSAEETRWVTAALTSITVVIKCDGYDMFENGMRGFGDVNGVDWVIFGPAVGAAVAAINGDDYKRADLIPEVTRLVTATLKAINDSLIKDKPTFCKQWGDTLVSKGILWVKK